MTATMKLMIEDREYDFDLNDMSMTEGIALEEEWGIQVFDFERQLLGGTPTMRMVTALMWLIKVRAIAAEQNLTPLAAAKQLPVATFDLKFSALRQPSGPEPVNPTDAGTRTPATRTTRATSGRPKPKRSSAPAASATSESSLSS